MTNYLQNLTGTLKVKNTNFPNINEGHELTLNIEEMSSGKFQYYALKAQFHRCVKNTAELFEQVEFSDETKDLISKTFN